MRFWTHYGAEVERTFTGELWTGARQIDGGNFVEVVDDTGLSTKPGRLHSGGNTGYQMVGLAAMFGARRIVLLGYDMQRGPRGENHHHGQHEGGLPNPTPENFKEWARRFIQLGADLRRQGIEVVNATRRTALTCFEPQPPEIAFGGRYQPAGDGRAASLLIPDGLLPAERAAFAAGLEATGYRVTGLDPAAAVSVVWGGRTKERVGGTVLVAENGYWSPPGFTYCALAVGGHNGAGQWPQGSQERLEWLGIAIRKWRTSGKHVLVCPSRGISTGAMPQPAGWVDRTVEELRRHTDRTIKVRQHPGDWKRLAGTPDATLRADLEGAWCAVVWNSAAGLRALALGIPVLCDAPSWICKPCAGGIQDVENPPMPPRLPVFQRMASAQWELQEIANGSALRALLEMGLAQRVAA